MKKEYLKYTPEELMQDREFVSCVLRGKNRKEWEQFQQENPEFETTLKKASEIVELLRDKHENLTEEEILALWDKIDRFDNQQKRSSQTFTLNRIWRYAAILVFALLVGGTAGYFLLNQKQEAYVFTNSPEKATGSQSRLILSNGTTVDLNKDDSKIALNADQKMVIDNKQVIDMSNASGADAEKMNEVVIPFGSKSQLVLPDGTKVWLNAGSRMAFPNKFSGKKREVFLEGEAYFEVTHNADVPFLVNTNDISVKVLGTKFNVSAYKTDKQTETVLLEGKVTVKDISSTGFMKKETALAPNQKASFDKQNKTIQVKDDPDADFAIAWTEGWFKFSQQSLNGVLNKIQRYYNVQFQYESDFSTNDLISGKLDLKESIGDVMTALSDVANIQYRINGDKIQIEKKLNGLKMR